VNGKVRGHVTLSRTATQDDAVKAALAVESVKPFTDGKSIKKVVFVAGRILNLVVG
jgi:leucyl-tRNA synthetase